MNNNSFQHLVSVLIPVYNAGKFLQPSVQSILDQTHNNLEIFIIDDGSTDNCMATLEGIQDSRVQILHKENGGKATALNLALKHMRGLFWMIQDADDISYPERVAKQLEALQKNPDLAAVYVGTDLIFRGKKFAPVYPKKTREVCKKEIESFKLPAHDATGMYRACMTNNLFFDNDLRIGQGVDFVWRVGELHSIEVIDECLYSHRVNYDSITHKIPSNNFEEINAVIRKACGRRGWDFERFKLENQSALLKKNRGMDSILPYAIESVITQKRKTLYMGAIKTALLCISFHPFDYMFYKPLLYLFIPDTILFYYRGRKARR